MDVATRAGADVEERLTLVEASVRVLPAVDPAQGSALLMGLLSPLMHVLAQGLQSTSPDEAAVRQNVDKMTRKKGCFGIADAHSKRKKTSERCVVCFVLFLRVRKGGFGCTPTHLLSVFLFEKSTHQQTND